LEGMIEPCLSGVPSTREVRQFHRSCQSCWISISGRCSFSCQKTALEEARTLTRESKEVSAIVSSKCCISVARSLSCPVQSVKPSNEAERGKLASVIWHHRVSPSLTYAFDVWGETRSYSTISIEISSLEVEVKRNEVEEKCSSTTLCLYVCVHKALTLCLSGGASKGHSFTEKDGVCFLGLGST
jgi:hypothetical protein